MFYGLVAERLHISPNDVEEMFVDLAEEQVTYWAEQAGGGSRSRPMSTGELASKFGGKVVKRG